MPSVEVNGVQINYIQFDCESENSCEDIVMIHGLATNLAFWYFHYVPEFSKYYRITLYDLRGHGRSAITANGYLPKNMAIDLKQFLDYLYIKRAHFIAHSFGGVVALNLACMNPDRFASLVLADTHIDAARILQEKSDCEFERRIQPILDRNGLNIDARDPYFGYRLLSAVAHLQNQNVKISKELHNLAYPFTGRNSKRTANQWLKLMEKTQAEKELMGNDNLTLDALRRLTFPILAIYGEYSHAMPTGRELLKVWPHADFRKIHKAGHFFPTTRPSDFIKSWRQFIRGALIDKVPLRKGDNGKRYFRSDRFFIKDDKWFFYTRESTKKGPFADFNEAQEYLSANYL
ncbi:MAG: alpha/beta fold hydrolase [Thermodesulfobacteriota bacterium]|nr:alpha/beta fold hydrolase [Thermodesulfobacteriota bacterium]